MNSRLASVAGTFCEMPFGRPAKGLSAAKEMCRRF